MRRNLSAVVLGVIACGLWSATAAAQHKHGPLGLSSDDVTRYARLLRMADTRTPDDSLARSALKGQSRPVRAEAALALAQLVQTHRDAVLPLLRPLLMDPDTAVAANAAFGVGLARDTASVAVLENVVRRGTAKTPAHVAVSEGAAWALGEIGAPARDPLARLLAERLAPAVTAALLLAEAKLAPMEPASLHAVLPHLTDRNETVVWAAAYALARRHAPGGVRSLLALRKPSPAVRAQIAAALVARVVGDSLQQDALRTLSSLLRDDYLPVRIAALRSSATYGAMARPGFLHALTDDDPNVRLTAAQVAAPVLRQDADEWRDSWNADTGFAFQSALLASSVEAGAPLPQLSQWRSRPEWQYRAAAVAAWRSSPDTLDAKLAALLASYDSDGRVRAASYDVLAAMDPTRQDTVVQRLLEIAARDSDLAAREALPWYQPPLTPADSASLHRPLSWYEGVVRDIVVPSLAGPPFGATVVTERGTIRVALLGVQAPLTVRNFIILAKRGYFNGLRLHRVVPAFVAQDGDPRGDGNGGPGYRIRDELTREPYARGAVGMALSGPDTGGSQYFFTLTPQPHLDGHYPLFARVVSGSAVLDALVQGDRIKAITVP